MKIKRIQGQSFGMKGKHHSEKTRRKMSLSRKGKPFTEEHRKNISKANKGKIRSEEIRKRMSETMKGKYIRENNFNWRGGMSFLPYPPIFNKELKQFIKDRDHNECQNPYCNGKSKRLRIHHIDFDKDNCSQFNLITLCISCNAKANKIHRWRRLYRKIVWSKYE